MHHLGQRGFTDFKFKDCLFSAVMKNFDHRYYSRLIDALPEPANENTRATPHEVFALSVDSSV